MKKLGLLGFICLVLFGCESDPLPELCKVADCRENKYVKMRIPNGIFEKTIELFWPVAYKNRISLIPGDIVFIEAEETDTGLGNFKLVEEVVNPEKTIEFSFTQIDNKIDMVLVVKNPFLKSIKYHLKTMDFTGNIDKVSSCPVKASSSVSEQWDYVVLELILTDMHFLEPNEVMSCIY
ncbi:MAG: hypothetical protein HRT52_13660 [Colwellia sp.]|nr:hypothetical protein [Colwellia sp.]